MKRVRNLLLRPAYRFLLSGLIAAVLTGLCFLVTSVTFLTNDDNAIAHALAGYQTGTPEAVVLFTNVLLGWPVSFLYRVLPTVPWWSVLQLFALWLSETLILDSLIESSLDAGLPALLPLAAFAALFALLLLPVTVQLTYTLTACVLGTAGVLRYASGIRKHRPAAVTGGVFLVLASFWLRDDTGLVMLCFLAAECFRMLLEKKKQILRTVLPVLLTVLLCAASYGINRSMHLSVNGKDYEEFFRWREQFSDFSRDSYKDNPDLYASVGWDENLYLLADSWCYLDERVNADTLKSISESSRHPDLSDAGSTLAAFFRKCPEADRMAVLILLLLLILLLGKPSPAALWTGIGIFLGSWVLTGYLCLTDRILLRSVQVIFIPAAFLLTDLALSCPACSGKAVIRKAAGILVLAGCCCFGLMQAYGLRLNSPKEMLQRSEAILSYAAAHRDTVLIADPFSAPDIHAFAVYPDGSYPDNLVSWGGCDFFSRASRKQLENHGITVLNETIFFAPSVRFLTRSGSAEERRLLNYLSGKYPGCAAEIIDRTGEDYAVYRFESAE